MYKIKNFFRNLKRSFSWFFFMWNNYEWDNFYLYKVIRKKLQDMYLPIKNGCGLTRFSHARMIKILIWYLDRLLDQDVCGKLYSLHEKKYGEINMFVLDGKLETCYTLCKDKEKEEHANNVLRKIHSIEVERLERCKKRFFHLLERWIDYLWD